MTAQVTGRFPGGCTTGAGNIGIPDTNDGCPGEGTQSARPALQSAPRALGLARRRAILHRYLATFAP